MATIALVLDHQEGHLIPTFPLARRLVERGHKVVYMTVADGGDFIRANGFDFVPILESLYPKGKLQTLREGTGLSKLVAGAGVVSPESSERHVQSLVEDRKLAESVTAVRPDLFVVSTHFSLAALILRLRFDLPVVLITPYLRRSRKAEFALQVENALTKMTTGAAALFRLVTTARPRARRLADVSDEFLGWRELILCPEALEIPTADPMREPEVHYVEAGVGGERPSEKENGFPWERLDPARKLLVCSMGSQSYMVGRESLLKFYGALARAVREEPSWQLVMATGGQIEASDLSDLPGDAVMARWIPQLALLRRAAAMVTHGGLGAVREAIASGVPMLVFPFTADQPANAERVVHHGMGLTGDLQSVTAEELSAMLLRIDREPSFRESVERMRERFLEVERSGIGVRLIEELLEKPEPSAVPRARWTA